MLDKLIDHLLTEWSIIKQAPIVCLLCFAIGLVCGWIVASKLLQERISFLRERISDYQERLGLVPKDRTAYSKMTNRELKKESEELVAKLHDFQRRISSEDRAAFFGDGRVLADLSEADKGRVWQQRNEALMSRSEQRNAEFQQNYRAQAQVLRNELLRRLPAQRSPMLPALDFGMLSGVHPVSEVATHLEGLARLLP